ncbi:MAG: S8 family peptidase [Candidatus Woesearchaeota archaeon]
MYQSAIEKNGILYVGVDSSYQALYRAGNVIVTTDSRSIGLIGALESMSRSESTPTLDSIVKKLEKATKKDKKKPNVTIFFKEGKKTDCFEVDVGTRQRTRKTIGQNIKYLSKCNQFGFISKYGTKTIYDPMVEITSGPPEYIGLFSRINDTKKRINDRAYQLFRSLIEKPNATDLVQRLISGYIGHEYGFINNLDLNRELSKIEKKYERLSKSPRKKPEQRKSKANLFRRVSKAREAFFDLASDYSRRETTDLVLEIPGQKKKEQREEIAYRLERTFGIRGLTLKYAGCISIVCATDESVRLIQAINQEFYSLSNIRNFTLRPAVVYCIPEMLAGKDDSGEIRISPIKIRKAKKNSGRLWNLENIGAYIAQKETSGEGVNVAVIDTGIDNRHFEIKDIYCGGYNFVDGNEKPFDGTGHGTHVSGTISGKGTGIAPGINLYAVKVLSDEGFGSEVLVNQGIEWCIDNDIDVLNMSLGSSYSTSIGEELCRYAAESGILLVAAAGNEGFGRSYPASYPGVISVAAVDKDNEHAEFSNICDTLDLSAPGVNIFSAWPGNAYNVISGTSMASPHVAGVCALGVSYYHQSDIEDRMKKSAERLGENDLYGSGLVRADLLIEQNLRKRKWRAA